MPSLLATHEYGKTAYTYMYIYVYVCINMYVSVFPQKMCYIVLNLKFTYRHNGIEYEEYVFNRRCSTIHFALVSLAS